MFFSKTVRFFLLLQGRLKSGRSRKILQIIIVGGFTILLLEMGLRLSYLFSPQIKYFLYSSRYDLNFSKIKTLDDLQKNASCPLRPTTKVNGFTINQKGFYTPDYQEEKPQDTLRVGFVGDSFLIGIVPYPQNFVNVFQGKMQGLLKDKKVEVINWGMPCLGPQYEEKILEIEGFKAQPDWLVWMFFVGNDFTDELVSGEKLPLPNLLAKNFYTLRLIRNIQKTLLGLQLNREVAQGNGSYDETKPTFPHDQYLKIQAEKLKLFSPQTFPHQSWQGIQQTLLEFKDGCSINQTKCLVVIIPDENQVNDQLLAEVVKLAKIEPQSLEVDYPQKLLVEFLSHNGLLYLDLLPIFQNEGQKRPLYHPADTHWNITGNQLVAEEIFKYFMENFLDVYSSNIRL